MASPKTSTAIRYYRGRLWKISWVTVFGPRGNKLRTVKHYERRDGIGLAWALVRSIVA